MRITREDQKTITAWAEMTFGPSHPAEIAARMNVEVAELINGLAIRAAVPVTDMPEEAKNALLYECADVFIMLAQVAEKLGGHLPTLVDEKMDINRRRVWERQASGKMQHVEGD